MLIAAVLKAHSVVDREQWLCDSFQGLPMPDAERFAADQGDNGSCRGCRAEMFEFGSESVWQWFEVIQCQYASLSVQVYSDTHGTWYYRVM